MNTLIENLITIPGVDTTELLYNDTSEVFWIDWREEDQNIIDYCAEQIQTKKLTSVWEDENLVLKYEGSSKVVPLTFSDADRHITLLTINEVLFPDYEVRMVWDSDGSDTLAFVLLTTSNWNELEVKYGKDLLSKAFLKLKPNLNVFTDPLAKHRPGKEVKKQWWKFW